MIPDDSRYGSYRFANLYKINAKDCVQSPDYAEDFEAELSIHTFQALISFSTPHIRSHEAIATHEMEK